jgi:phosphotransferase system enzyme I (PtsP)
MSLTPNWGNSPENVPLQRSARVVHAASRRLIARLRDIMAGAEEPAVQLDRIVALIAAELVAEVCSCYVLRAGDLLELFSTVGLNKAAVHNTRLHVGEGLVGDIAAHARPLALSDAPSHPNFAYRAETGEDPYQSLAGVPILRGGRVRGVLAIQNRRSRTYTADEIETLQTVATIIAELVVGGLVAAQELSSAGDAVTIGQRLTGVGMNGGSAFGIAVLHRRLPGLQDLVAENPETEAARLRAALDSMHRQIDQMIERSGTIGGASLEILETYRLFAQDQGWLSRIEDAIRQGLTAEAAVVRVQDDNRARLSQVADPYLRERLLDLEDLSSRVLIHLGLGQEGEEMPPLPDNAIVIARALGPAELLDYDHGKLVGLVLEEGSSSSHVAIIARALGLPLIGQCMDALTRIEPGDSLIVDGAQGQVYVRPSEDIIETFHRTLAWQMAQDDLYRESRSLPAVTLDGINISLLMNAGLPIELPQLAEVQAEGIGLFRTEIPFMVRAKYPDLETQIALYRDIYAQAAGKPVTFRTLDVGGDKALPSFAVPVEENPALGWRAVRIGLDRPAMLRSQIRALLIAADGRELRIMFPLVAEVAELDAARGLLRREVARLAAKGSVPIVKTGVMLEAPSLLWQLDALLPGLDFVSVGSNDLMQYLYAADRNNARSGGRYDTLSPPLLNALAMLQQKCRAAGVPVSVCGDMASRPLDVMVLIGLGFEIFSMPAQAIGPVKLMIRSLEKACLDGYLPQILRSRHHSLRQELHAFAQDHNVRIEES